MEQLTNTQKQMLQVIADNNEVRHMCTIFATAMLLDDIATVKHIAINYAHMFNEEQRRTAQAILEEIVKLEKFEAVAAELATATIATAMQ